MIYTRDLPADADAAMLQAEHEHVRAYLSAAVDEDDDPDTNADDVKVKHETLDDGRTRITGFIDADPVAPYLVEGYNPLVNVDDELLRAAGVIG